MKKWKWQNCLAIILFMLGIWNIYVGVVGGNGVWIFTGAIVIICAIQLFCSKDKKREVKE